MEIEDALKETGFVLCEFTSGGDEIEDECSHCCEVIPEGDKVYYERTCYEVDEGEYYCEQCVISCAENGQW